MSIPKCKKIKKVTTPISEVTKFKDYSTVTDLARFLGLSTSIPLYFET